MSSEFATDKSRRSGYITYHWNWMNSYWMFWRGGLSWRFSASSFCDLGCVYKILLYRESRFWNTDLKHGFETRFYGTAFVRVFSRACFLALSDCAIAAHLILRSLSLGKKTKQGARFSISIIVTSFKPCLRSLLRL